MSRLLLLASNTKMMVFLSAMPLFADHNITHNLSPPEHLSGVCSSRTLQKYGGNSRALNATSKRRTDVKKSRHFMIYLSASTRFTIYPFMPQRDAPELCS